MSLLFLTALLTAPMAAASVPQPGVVAQGVVRSVTVGDPLRRTLMDALRPTIERDLGQPVQFMVEELKVQGDWAFYGGRPQQPNGRPIDFSRTRYADRLENGVFDGGGATWALLRRSGGQWRVVNFVVGPTDVAYLAWVDQHGAPAALLGM